MLLYHYNKYFVMYQNPSTTRGVCQSIEAQILEGSLQPGSLLPTVRDLAGTLGLSPTTVAAAYRRLRDRGVVITAGRGGTRVAEVAPVRAAAVPESMLQPDVMNLASGNPDPELLPPLETVLHEVAVPAQAYESASVLPELLAFAAAEFESDGIPRKALAVLGGGLDAIERVLREEARPGDVVAVEDPGLPGLIDLLRAGGLRPAPFPVDDDGPVPTGLARVLKTARVVIITPRAQNPTGSALTVSRAGEIRQVLARHQAVLLIEDDYAGPVSGVPLVTLCDGSLERWASVRSVTKWLGPDLRLALLAGDPLTVGRVTGRQALGTRWVSRILQRTALGLWSDPSSGRRLARAADVYARRRRALVGALDARGIPARARSGFNVWVPVADEAAVVRRLAERGWAVAPGSRFRQKAAPGVRITVSALAPEAAGRLAADLAEVLGTALPALA